MACLPGSLFFYVYQTIFLIVNFLKWKKIIISISFQIHLHINFSLKQKFQSYRSAASFERSIVAIHFS